MKILNWRRALAAALTAGGMIVPTTLLAADLQVNLVNDPGFENVDTQDPGPFTSVRLLDWTDADADDDDHFAYPYSVNYSGIPAPPGAASYHFTGGFSTTSGSATITQSFDVSAGDSGALIATGNARYDLRGFFSTYFDQGDASRARARFLNPSMVELGSADIGGQPFLLGLPLVGGKRYWGQDAHRGILPVGTATVAIDIIPDGSATNYDGYVDQLDFRVGGLPNDIALALQVNTTNGQARMNNLTGEDIDFKYYEIASATGSLDPDAWSSLQEQNLSGFPAGNGTGNGWEEAGGVSDNILAESYLVGSSLLASGQKVNLGAPFVTAAPQDLVFRYGLDDGLLLYGVVEYVSSFGISCDFNGDSNCDIQISTR